MVNSFSLRRIVGAGIASAAALVVCSAPNAAGTADWTRIQHEALRGGGHVVYVHDVLAGDGGSPWVAVGYTVDSEGSREPSAWTSADGVSWRRDTMPPTGSPERRDGPLFVARRGSTLVALGQRFDGRLWPAAWYSHTPGTWQAITDAADPLMAYSGQIWAIDAGPSGFVAVGVRHFAPSYSEVTVFASENGQAWRVATVYRTPSGEGFQPFGVSAASGTVVIVGDDARGGASDGRIWVIDATGAVTRVDPQAGGLAGDGLQQVADVTWRPDRGFVAAGATTRARAETPAAWTSSDGKAWSRSPDGSIPVVGAGAIHTVISTPSGFFAAGSTDGGVHVWQSTNGASWSLVPPPSAQSIGRTIGVASDGSKLVVTTTAETGSQIFHRVGSQWLRGDQGPAFPKPVGVAAQLRDVAVSGRRIVAVGSDGSERPLVMVSNGGAAWKRTAFSDRAARLEAIGAHRGLFTIAGWRLVAGRAALTLWTSRNGTKWTRLGGARFDPTGAFVDLASTPAGLQAVALEPSGRGLHTTIWSRRGGTWAPVADLGAGVARALCHGPNGTTAVAVVGSGGLGRVVTWTRRPGGSWPREPQVLSSRASAERCADGPSATVVVGGDSRGAVAWRLPKGGRQWSQNVVTFPSPASLYDIARDGAGFYATGSFTGRGQVDLGVWRSTDGSAWTQIGGPVFFEPGFQAGLGIASSGANLVVAGRHGAGNAGLWMGPKLTTGGPNEPGPVSARHRFVRALDVSGSSRLARKPVHGRVPSSAP